MANPPDKSENDESESSGFKEGIDFYVDESGLYVMTKEFLLRRGFCCHKGCRHCPYGNSPADK